MICDKCNSRNVRASLIRDFEGLKASVHCLNCGNVEETQFLMDFYTFSYPKKTKVIK